jgi:uncharacterized protein YqgC (DUF456 family)
MKKGLLILLGTLFIIVGAVFAIVPGPSLIFLIAGLLCFSFYYPKARYYLAICQKALTKSCAFLDKKIAKS